MEACTPNFTSQENYFIEVAGPYDDDNEDNGDNTKSFTKIHLSSDPNSPKMVTSFE